MAGCSRANRLKEPVRVGRIILWNVWYYEVGVGVEEESTERRDEVREKDEHKYLTWIDADEFSAGHQPSESRLPYCSNDATLIGML